MMLAYFFWWMHARWRICLALFLFGWSIPEALLARPRTCAPDCTCNTVSANSNPAFEHGQRVKCHNPHTITDVETVTARLYSPDVLILDLSGNSISALVNGSFVSFTKLDRLNLARNGINIIKSGAFIGLGNLKLLNLSHNSLRIIDDTTFLGLGKLEKLILLGNQLSHLANGTLEALPLLHYLDLSQNPLICDCNLQWITTNWSVDQRVQLSRRTICQFPPQLNGFRLVKVKHWHCNWPLQIPVFNLQPSESQLVFAGDSLRIRCQVSVVEPRGSLMWALNNEQVEFDSEDVVVETEKSEDGMVLLGSLSILHLQPSHGGTWTCRLNTSSGDRMESVSIKVLSESTKYCEPSVSVGNKGQYAWPRTVEGVTVELPCWSTSSASSRKQPSATRVCSELGIWERLDTSKCPYISEVTKVLEQFAKTNLNITSSSVIESVHRLRNYTADGSVLRDKMDVVFITKTINNYLDFIPKSKEIGDALLDIISTVMRLNPRLLKEAQLEERACSRLIEAIERLPEFLTERSVARHHPNLALEEFAIKSDNFQGITCASFVRNGIPATVLGRNASIKKAFRCKLGNATEAPEDDEFLEASIQIPSSLFHSAKLQHIANHRLQVTVYHDAALFPRTQEPKYSLNVLSNVIGCNLAKYSVSNLTDPVRVTLRSPSIVGEIVPVWWDFSANGNLGDWASDGCKLWNVYGNLVSFHCDRLANFGLLQDVEKVAMTTKRKLGGAKFRLFHPVIYLGSTIGVLCFLTAIVTYILGFKLIHVPKKNKHSLINTWLAAMLLCLTFTLGVRHTENAKICQGAGLLLHYFTLVCLLWMIITASNTYKKLNRSEPFQAQDEIPPDYPLPPKPMLRFYLVGWGVPVIVCGISGAVNMEDYAGYDYCFLAFTHSVGAFYGPCSALVLLLCIFYLLIFCAIQKLNDNDKDDKRSGQDGTGIELVETNAERTSERSAKATSDGSNDEDDMEHLPISQLRSQVVILLVFLLCWASAAVATVDPLFQNFLSSELFFAMAFALSLTSLGVFVLMFHCVTREDVRLVWKLLSRCKETGIVRETEPLPNPVLPAVRSNDSLNSCYTNKSCSTSRSVDGARVQMVMAKVSNVEAAAMANAGGVTDTSWSGEMFYNPYQNGVARKFFRKHSRQPRPKNEYSAKDNLAEAEMGPRHHYLNVHNSKQFAADKVSKSAVCRDRSTDSQLVNSSSQGLVSVSPSQSGNCSEKSLLIVEEEEEDDGEAHCPNRAVDWGPGGDEDIYESATFSPSEHPRDFGLDGSDGATDCSQKANPDCSRGRDADGNLSSQSIESLPEWVADPGCSRKKRVGGEALPNQCGETLQTRETVEPQDEEDSSGDPGQVREKKARHKGGVLQSQSIERLSGLPHDRADAMPKSETLPRSSWDKQWQQSGKSKRPVYAFVNHSCHQQLGDALNGIACKGVTRSASMGDAELTAMGDAKASKRAALEIGENCTQDQKVKKETAV